MADPVVKVGDVLQASRGMLQKQLYAVFTRPVNGLGPVMENLGPHLEFQVDLERRGIMFGAGPFWTDDGERWEGEGMGHHPRGLARRSEGHRRVGPHAQERRADLHRPSVAAQRRHLDGEDHLFRRQARDPLAVAPSHQEKEEA